MLQNNEAWAKQPEHAALFAKNAKGQAPKALWLGCSDSRKPESVLTVRAPDFASAALTGHAGYSTW